MLTPDTIIGARLGAYEVQAPIGSGGMATVYRGFDHNLQRPVAIKVLAEHAAAQPGFAERFRQEARLIASLRHPNIVHIYDFGEQDRVVYMVQELLPGPTLQARMAELAARGQPMPRIEVLDVARQLAAALDAAHAAGIIHRDVKPSNALWNALGALVLTDFGIAKNTLADVSQTQTGVVLGTPVYVSPEQARAEPLTPASDIYALGVVLYELIGGRPPFDGPTPLGLALRHIQEPPPPLRQLRASVPATAEAVVQRALAKRPAERFGSAGELVRALEAAWPAPNTAPTPRGDIHSLPTTAWQPPHTAPRPAAPAPPATAGAPAQNRAPAAPPQRQPRRALPILAGMLALLLIGGALLALRGEGPTPAGPSSATPVVVTDEPLGRLRALLGAGDPALDAALDAAGGALAAGDSAAAAASLSELQAQLLQARRDGRITPDQMRAALGEVQALADTRGLRLPLTVGR